MGEESLHLCLIHFSRMTFAAEQDESPNPSPIGFFGTTDVMVNPHLVPDIIAKHEGTSANGCRTDT